MVFMSVSKPGWSYKLVEILLGSGDFSNILVKS